MPAEPLPADALAAGGNKYYGEILGIDRAVGELREGLRKLHVAENTLVWFNSDNGAGGGGKNQQNTVRFEKNGNLRGTKFTVWEGGIRVPGIIEWPGVVKPHVTDMPAGTIDIYPTLMDLAGVQVDNQVQPVDGISLAPWLKGQEMKEPPAPMGFWTPGGRTLELGTGHAALIDNRYKLHKIDGKFELYDLDTLAAESESRDISGENPEVVGRMKAALEKWQQSVLRSWQGEDYKQRTTGTEPGLRRPRNVNPGRDQR